MQDTELRDALLKVLYAHRKDRFFCPKESDFPFFFHDTEIVNIARQLKQLGLVEAHISDYLDGSSSLVMCQISARGIDTVESGSSSNQRINQVSQQNISISGSSNVVIGNNNQQSINHSVQELARVIDSSSATPEQKEEAKSLLKKFLEHPLLAAIAGGAVGLLG